MDFKFLIANLVIGFLISKCQNICEFEECICNQENSFNYVTCNLTNFFKRTRNTTHFTNTVDTLTIHVKNGNANSIPARFLSNLDIYLLIMSDNGFRNIPAEIFEQVLSIKNVYFSDNKLEEINFQEFPISFRSNVESLILKNNSLKNIPSLDQFKHLNFLDLSFNKIENFSGLYETKIRMESLDLSNNFIKSIDFNRFSDEFLNSLSDFNLDSNLIENIEIFCNFSNLYFLSMSRNKLTRINSKFLSLLFNLNELDLSGNQIESIESNSFDSLEKLTKLDLSFNRIKHLNLRNFKKMPNLEKIFLQSNQIYSINFIIFNHQSSSLYLVDLSANNLTKIEFKYSNKFNKLSLLRLSFNKLETFDLDSNKAPNLKMLFLENNFLSRIPSDLTSLIKLDISKQNDRLTVLPDYAFQRDSSNSQVLLKLNLSYNFNLTFGNKSFCIKTYKKDSNGFLDLYISNYVDKCILKQLSLSYRRTRVFFQSNQTKFDKTSPFCDCQYRLYLARYFITIKDVCPRYKTYCFNQKFYDDCISRDEFNC